MDIENKILNEEERFLTVLHDEQVERLEKIVFGAVCHELLLLKAEQEEAKVESYLCDVEEKIKEIAPITGEQLCEDLQIFKGSERYEPYGFEQGAILNWDVWAIRATYSDWEELGFPESFCKRVLKKFINEGILCRKKSMGGYLYFFPDLREKIRETKLQDRFYHYGFHCGYGDAIVYFSEEYQVILDGAPKEIQMNFKREQEERWFNVIKRRIMGWGDKVEGELSWK